MFGRKKKKNDLYSKGDISSIAQKVDVLIEMNKDEEIGKKLKTIKEELRYAYPSINENVIAVEKKIVDKLDDIKLDISAARNEKVLKEIDEANVLMAERKAYIK